MAAVEAGLRRSPLWEKKDARDGEVLKEEAEPGDKGVVGFKVRSGLRGMRCGAVKYSGCEVVVEGGAESTLLSADFPPSDWILVLGAPLSSAVSLSIASQGRRPALQ